mmetsp:Transcript_92551/g.247507  ORF Transcript_92551/g.247507 Transcript_92551/m.247507 type:complete len:92 (-) Transcript_92551:16-291(-)
MTPYCGRSWRRRTGCWCTPSRMTGLPASPPELAIERATLRLVPAELMNDPDVLVPQATTRPRAAIVKDSGSLVVEFCLFPQEGEEEAEESP